MFARFDQRLEWDLFDIEIEEVCGSGTVFENRFSFWLLHSAWRAGSARGSARQVEIPYFDKSMMQKLMLAVNECCIYRNIIFDVEFYIFQGYWFFEKNLTA